MNEIPEQGAAVAAPPKKSRRGLAVGIVAALVLIGAAAWFFFGRGGSGMADFFDPNATTGILPGMTEEQIIEELNRIVEEGMFNISINTQPEFPDGSSPGNLCIENSPANHYLMVVEITLNDTGEQVYTSGALEPNYHIQEAKLDRALAKGTYPATATFYAYTADTQELVGTAGAEMQLIIQN